ncbi:MAG: hypothetical protein M1820_006664 [Bogoriella megaspora]|nr:MAG: hypothetical protein M1820_006664 [Bogoriella megaspora]
MDFLKAQFTKIPRIAPRNLTNNTVLITGATGGLGFETARQILESKLKRVILAIRDLEKGKAVLRELEKEKFASTNIEIRSLDQATFSSVQGFVRDLKEEPIHIAILNAGSNMEHKFCLYQRRIRDKFASQRPRARSALAPPTTQSPPIQIVIHPFSRRAITSPHLTFVASGLHEMAKFPEKSLPQGEILAALNDSKRYVQQDRYPTTKVISMLWMKELARRIQGEQIVINQPNPGFCKTDLMRHAKGMTGFMVKVFTALVARSAQDGARCILDSAVIKGSESHGCYVSETVVKPASKVVRDAELSELQGNIFEEITTILKAFDSSIRVPNAI